MENVLAILLAGGPGEQLYPLTRYTAKAGVPFGGAYRMVDFTLSNCVNSDLKRIFILTQSHDVLLQRHLRDSWDIFAPELDEYLEIVSPVRRNTETWYAGTADAVYQNLSSILAETKDVVMVAPADHIYKMNYARMVDWHRTHNADVTVATLQVSPTAAHRFGVAKVERDFRIAAFVEQSQGEQLPPSIFQPSKVSVSMAVYLFNTNVLVDELERDSCVGSSTRDFGKDILPQCLSRRRVIAYDFVDVNAKSDCYWRDPSSVDALYAANMDLLSVDPQLNLYDRKWPVPARTPHRPPAKFVFAEQGTGIGRALDSLVSPGCIISGARVQYSVLSPDVTVENKSDVESSILMPGVSVGANCRVRRAILDTGVQLPEGSDVGYDVEHDRARGYLVTDSGIVVVPGPDPAAGGQ